MKTNTVIEALRKARAITNEDALRNATDAAQQARWVEELDREERALRRRMVDGQVERDEALIKRVKARDAKARAEKAQQARWDEAEARKARAKARAERDEALREAQARWRKDRVQAQASAEREAQELREALIREVEELEAIPNPTPLQTLALKAKRARL